MLEYKEDVGAKAGAGSIKHGLYQMMTMKQMRFSNAHKRPPKI